jgi:hypothetical protein
MTTSPVSHAAEIQQSQKAQAQQASKTQQSPERAPDTVQLSAAAAAQLKGGDVDHDGDSH